MFTTNRKVRLQSCRPCLVVEQATELVDETQEDLKARLRLVAELSRSAMWELGHPIDGGQVFRGEELGQVLESHGATFGSTDDVVAEFGPNSATSGLPAPAVVRGEAADRAAFWQSSRSEVCRREVPHCWTANRPSVSWTRRRPTTDAKPAPVNAVAYVRYTAVSAIRTRNKTQETLDLTPRPGAVITPGRALIRARR